MTARYWVKNGAATSANTAAAWNTAANGSGSTGVPTTNDDVHIGHADTLAAGLGNAQCTWDLALTLSSFTTYEGYNTATITSNLISFTAASTITHANSNWEDLGFRAGMQIVVSGASDAANNATVDIASISSNVITISQTSAQTEAAGASVTITATIKLSLHANTTTSKFVLDTTLCNTTGSGKVLTLQGGFPSGTGNRYVLNGDNAVIENQSDLTYKFDTSANGSAKMPLDDGPYPKVETANATLITPEYSTPTSNEHGSVDIYSLIIGSAATFQPDASPSATATQNASKVFNILTTSTFAIGGSVFDAGFSTFAFTMNATDWTVPVTGDTTYGTAPFVCRFYNFILRTPSTAGYKALIPNNRTLSVNSLTVEADAVLKGHITAGSGFTSTICSVCRPVVQGSWNFSQLSDGVYVSLMSDTFPITPSDGPVGRVQLSNDGGTFASDANLTFSSNTLHADQAIKLTESADHATAPAAGTGLVWVKNTDPSTLIFTDDAGTDTTLGSGGGGGITALTGDVTASGSGSVAATLDIDGMAAGGEPVNADLLVMDDGANGTNRKITFTQVASWIENNVSVAHIRDARADGDIHPNEFPDKAVSFNFTDDITGSPNTWDSVITMKGWTDNYRAWQIWSSAASGSQSVDQVPLFFRSGEEDVQDGWGTTKEILTFAGTAPRVDGAANQVLQTDGAGTLAWANVGPKVQMMKLTKTGTSDIDANLVYDISNNQASVIDIGSANWTEDTAGTSHPAIEVLPDFGIKFNTAGIYRIDTGFYFHSNSAVTGGITCLMRASTDAPDPSQTGYYPSGGAAIDKGFNRFDYYISGQNLSLDPDFNMIFNAAANDTIYLYAYVNGIGTAKWRVRGHGSEPLSQITITRIGDAQT